MYSGWMPVPDDNHDYGEGSHEYEEASEEQDCVEEVEGGAEAVDEVEQEQEELASSGYDNVDARNHDCIYSYPTEWISNVTVFCCEESAIRACNEYQKKNFCALAHIRGGGRPDLANGKRGKINLVCVQGIDHKRTRTTKPLIRKKQHNNFKACRMRIFIRQQLNGLWILRSFVPDHVRENGDIAHLSGADVYKLSRQAKQSVDEEAMGYIKEFKKVNAHSRAIADRLGDVFNVHYNAKDIGNRARKIMFDSDKENVEVFLDEIVKGGGKVEAKYREGIDRWVYYYWLNI